MIITGISADEFTWLVKRVSVEQYHGNLHAEIVRVYSPNRFRARVMVHESGARASYGPTGRSAPGARRSASGRRLAVACWHAYRDALAAVFEQNPNARVQTAMAKYVHKDGFYDNYPKTAAHNIGSMAAPAYMPDLCDCDHWGIDTREEN